MAIDDEQSVPQPPGAHPQQQSMTWLMIALWMCAIAVVRFVGLAAVGELSANSAVFSVLALPFYVGIIWCLAACATLLVEKRMPRAKGVLIGATVIAALHAFGAYSRIEAVDANTANLKQEAPPPTIAIAQPVPAAAATPETISGTQVQQAWDTDMRAWEAAHPEFIADPKLFAAMRENLVLIDAKTPGLSNESLLNKAYAMTVAETGWTPPAATSGQQ